MKRVFMLLALAVLVLPSFGQGINFQEVTIDEAVAKAKAEGKYVFIDFYTAWYSPCKMMDAQIYPLKEAGDYFNAKYVSLKLNAEAGVEGPKYANKLKIKAYPTFVILDGEGELVHMFSGGLLDVDNFIAKVEESFDDTKALGKLKKRYEAGEKDPKLVAAYLKASMNMNADVSALIDDFYKVSSDEDKISNDFLFIFDKYAPIGSDREVFFRENIDKFREVADNAEVDRIAKAKYEEFFGLIVKYRSGQETVENIEKKAEDLAEYHLTDLGKIPVFKAAAIFKIKQENKEAFLEELKSDVPKMEERDRDLALYIIIPGLKDLLTEKEKDDLLALVTNENVKGYVIRSAYQ